MASWVRGVELYTHTRCSGAAACPKAIQRGEPLNTDDAKNRATAQWVVPPLDQGAKSECWSAQKRSRRQAVALLGGFYWQFDCVWLMWAIRCRECHEFQRHAKPHRRKTSRSENEQAFRNKQTNSYGWWFKIPKEKMEKLSPERFLNLWLSQTFLNLLYSNGHSGPERSVHREFTVRYRRPCLSEQSKSISSSSWADPWDIGHKLL